MIGLERSGHAQSYNDLLCVGSSRLLQEEKSLQDYMSSFRVRCRSTVSLLNNPQSCYAPFIQGIKSICVYPRQTQWSSWSSFYINFLSFFSLRYNLNDFGCLSATIKCFKLVSVQGGKQRKLYHSTTMLKFSKRSMVLSE